jgi:PBSX family phage portal protein
MTEITTKDLRTKLRLIQKQESKNDALTFGSRQSNPEEGLWTNAAMESFNLLVPPYEPNKLYSIVESSGTLGSCVEVMVDNVDGFGHEFQYLGDMEDLNNPKIIEEREFLINFFKRVNEKQSFTKLRKEMRRDYEITGNSFMEIVRYPSGKIATLYRCDSRYMRLQAKQQEEVKTAVRLFRDGKLTETNIYRRFRRFAMVTNTSIYDIRFFKEYGDPRKMCAITGKYEDELGPDEEIQQEASEVIHFKQGNDTYGIPKWVGISSTVLGVRDADYINYNLFSDQGIPPLAVLVSGGRLTADSVEDLINIFNSRKGVENYHNIAILEAAPADGDIDDIATGAKIDFKPLPQQNDILFKDYIDTSEKRIRAKFRIPALYLGVGEEFSRSTSQNIQMIAEQQSFSPERNDEDELINFTLMQDLGAINWRLRTIGPKLIQGQEAIDAIGKFARAGSLSINQSIKVMNRVLELDAPLFDEPWADYPATMVLELSKRGWLKDSDKIAEIKHAVTNIAEKFQDTEFEYLKEQFEDLAKEFQEIKDTKPIGEVRFK